MFVELNTEQGIFRSLVNKDKNLFRMDFNPSDRYPYDLVVSSFNREVDYLIRLQKYKWAPEVTEIDVKNRSITFKWYNNTGQDMLVGYWKDQLKEIANDLHREGIYKPSFYPKYFYTDDNDQLHAFAFYSASDYSEQPISMDFYKPILNKDRLKVVEDLSVDGKLDMRLLVEKAFTDYIKWPDDVLPKIYEEVYG